MLNNLLIILIRCYQLFVSPAMVLVAGNHGCKFRPTCSEYTISSIQEYGVIRGIKMGLKRVVKCR